MSYQLVILAIKTKRTEYFVKKYLTETLDYTPAAAQALIAALPAVVLESEDRAPVEAACEALTRIGAEAQINSPHLTYCSYHVDQPVTGRCEACNGSLCAHCRSAAQGRELCGNCNQQRGRRRRWMRYRHAAALGALLVVAGVAGKVYYEDRRKLDWDRTYNIALVEVVKVNESGKNNRRLTLSAREKDRLAQALEDWFSGEFSRITGKRSKPFQLQMLGPILTEEPAPGLPTAADSWWTRYTQTAAFMSYFRRLLEKSGAAKDPSDIYIYLYTADGNAGGDRHPSVGTTRDRFGAIFVRGDQPLAGNILCTIAHEILHTVGAQDKYDNAYLTVYPDGYFEPERRYPQRYAEIMALAIPLAPGKEVDADDLGRARVGAKTATEIGWK